jgi:PAS domain S-box-containing protein
MVHPVLRRSQPVAGVLLAVGALLTLVGLLVQRGGGDGVEAFLAAGVALLVAGGWQWWLMGRTQEAMADVSAELALRERAVQHAGSPVLVTDNQLAVLWCNQAFERDTGYPLDMVRGRRPSRLLRSPNADPVAVARIRAAVRDHQDIDIELLHRYRDGRDRWVRVVLTAQRDAQGLRCGFVSVLIDIDVQVRTREALRRALRHQSALMNTLDEYVIVAEADRQGCIKRVNQRFLEVSGYREDELLGQRFSVLGSGRQPPAFWRSMWKRISRGLPWQGEICNRRKDGQLFWVQSLVAPFLGADGSIEKFICIQSDISALRRTQIELRQSESLLRQTSLLAGVGGWSVTGEAGPLVMTPECRQILGVREDELSGYDELWRCFGTGARLLVRNQLQELARGERTDVSLLAPLRQASGAQASWVRLVASLRDADTEGEDPMPRSILGAVQDYTPHMQAQQRIREEQRILHSAMDAVGEAFALFDPDQRLVYFNEAYAAWFPPDMPAQQGLSHVAVLEAIARSWVFPDAAGREAEWVQDVLRVAPAQEADRLRQTADGRWFRFTDRVTPDGHRVVLRSDVTELQTALMRADAAAESKGQFLANMSHEIRTPINAVMGLLQLLGHTRLAPEQADMVRKSLMATRSLLDILNDILDFSKIEAGKMSLHEVPFRLSDLRHELEVILTGARGHKPLDLRLETDASVPDVVVGDPVRLKQVLINLGGNAIKFTETGAVCLRWQRLPGPEGQVRIRFEVQDSGIGIAPEQQLRIFDSFSQGEASTARRFGGSGLGLTISQRLVALMGGQITLQSELGRGSCFGFDIVLREALPGEVPMALLPPVAAAGERLQGLRLLLAEDNALNQEVALAMLRREGATVVLAENGQQAVDALAAEPAGFDLVLMDMQMPVLDGLQATERIREGLGLRELPVLAMTANAMQSDRERCLQAGMNAHLGKPFDIDQVVALILRFTGRPGLIGDAVAALPPAGPASALATAAALREDQDSLRRLGGNAQLLAQLRAQFPASAREAWRRAQARAARGEWAEAADALHQMKGAAGVVGAPHLALLSGGLEQALRDHAPDPADAGTRALLQRIGALEDTLEQTLAALAEADPATAPVAPVAQGAEAWAACLADLRSLKLALDQADMQAIDQHEAWLARYPMARDERFRIFNEQVEALDLQAAGQTCAALLTEVAEGGWRSAHPQPLLQTTTQPEAA